jgi:F-type H+/Na+-transporting ATPase subunit alpha
LTELLKQPQYRPVPVEEQVAVIFAGVRGYLDKIDVGRIGAFEAQFLTELKSREAGILDAIRTDQEIKPEVDKKLTSFLDNFAKSFA